MAITIKSPEQIKKMRAAGDILRRLDLVLQAEIKAGITTKELDTIAEDFIRSNGAIPGFKGYGGFPGTLCISVNEEVIHGIPGPRKLKDGDIVSIDMGSIVDGFYGDCARTYGVGEISEADKKLIEVTKQSFFEGIKYAKAGNHLYEISAAIQKYVESNGFSVVRDLCGHGVGVEFHEEPDVEHFGKKGTGMLLVPGMTFTIEPMINMGTHEVFVDEEDDWTVVTEDELPSAQWEHTFVMTENGLEILTY